MLNPNLELKENKIKNKRKNKNKIKSVIHNSDKHTLVLNNIRKLNIVPSIS